MSLINVAGSAWISKAVTATAQLLAIPLIINKLGKDSYATFALLQTLVPWFALADGGIGHSLQNHISECRAKGSDYSHLIATSFFLISIAFVVVLLTLFITVPSLSLIFLRESLFLDDDEKRLAVLVISILSLIIGFGGIGYKAWYATGRGHLSNIIPAIASIAGLAIAYIAAASDVQHKLILVCSGYTLPFAAAGLLSLLHLWLLQKDKKKRVTSSSILIIISRAWRFWLLAIMAAFVLQVDYLVASQLLKPDEIIAYSVTSKIFGVIFFVVSSSLMVIWPVFTEQITNGAWIKVFSYTRIYISLGIAVVVIGTILLSTYLEKALSIVSPSEIIQVPSSLIIAMGIYYSIRVWTDSFAIILQSMSRLKVFFVLIPLQALISIVSQIIFTATFGPVGIVVGLIISFLLTVSWALPKVVISASKAGDLS